MSYADEVFKSVLDDLIKNGVSDGIYSVRPRWDDGEPAHTIAKFGVATRYDLSKNFPLITLRNPYLKSAVDEMLWIWQKKSNNTHDLKSHVWDQWADENGSIKKAYGYQQAKFHKYNGVTPEGLLKAFPGIRRGVLKPESKNEFNAFGFGHLAYGFEHTPDKSGLGFIGKPIAFDIDGQFYMTQIDKVIYDLVNNPVSRRMIVTMWNPDDLSEMALEPCAHTMNFSVVGRKLNGMLIQRSQDFLTAFAWNECQYAALTLALASIYGFEPGEFMHVITNCHLYDRHIPIAQELADAPEHDEPTVRVNPEVKSFYDLTPQDFIVEGYEANKFDIKIPVAI